MSSRKNPTLLSDSRRRIICRWAFVLCAIVPTLFAVRQVFSPSSTTGIETALRAATGITANVRSVETPRPGFFTLRSVGVPTSDGKEFLLGTVHVAVGHVCQVEIPETVRVDCSDLTGLVRQFCEAVLPATQAGLKASTPVSLLCRRLIVSDRDFPDDPARQLILSPLEFHFAADSDRSLALMRFQIAGSKAARPVEIIIEKPVQSSVGTQQVRVTTGESLIPVWLAKAMFPEADGLLPTGMFTGQIELAVDDSGKTNGTINGSIYHADLQAILAGTSLDVTGNAYLLNLDCAVESSRVRSFSTILSAHSGTLGRASLETMTNLGWQASFPAAGVQSTRFLHFQLECKYENGRVEFWPLKGNENNAVAWNDENQVVVSTSRLQTVAPMEGLARKIFQSPGSAPASVDSLGDQAVRFLSRFNLAPDAVVSGSSGVRMAENDRASTNR